MIIKLSLTINNNYQLVIIIKFKKTDNSLYL